MWLKTKILAQLKSLPPRLRLALLVMLGGLILAVLFYSLRGPASDDRITLIPLSSLTSPLEPELSPTPPAAATEAPTVTANEAALPTVEPETEALAASPNAFHLSLADSAQSLASVNEVRDEDILSYDGTNFALVFDGSTAGLAANADIDAFDFVDGDTVLMSFDKPAAIGELNVDDSDIVKFEATRLGPNNTAGTFSLFFKGATVGLTTSSENVDAFSLLPDGSLLISTEGRGSVPGINGNLKVEEEDILAFAPAAPGDYSSGDWSLYFDGSRAGIKGGRENIDGFAIGPEGEMYLTTSGKFSVKGIGGSGEDIFIYTPTSLGSSLAATFSPTLFFDGRLHGLKRDDVDAISVP